MRSTSPNPHGFDEGVCAGAWPLGAISISRPSVFPDDLRAGVKKARFKLKLASSSIGNFDLSFFLPLPTEAKSPQAPTAAYPLPNFEFWGSLSRPHQSTSEPSRGGPAGPGRWPWPHQSPSVPSWRRRGSATFGPQTRAPRQRMPSYSRTPRNVGFILADIDHSRKRPNEKPPSGDFSHFYRRVRGASRAFVHCVKPLQSSSGRLRNKAQKQQPYQVASRLEALRKPCQVASRLGALRKRPKATKLHSNKSPNQQTTPPAPARRPGTVHGPVYGRVQK